MHYRKWKKRAVAIVLATMLLAGNAGNVMGSEGTELPQPETEESTEEVTVETSEEVTEEVTEEETEEPTEEATEEETEELTEETEEVEETENATEEPTEKETEEPTEEATEKETEEPTEEATEEATEESAGIWYCGNEITDILYGRDILVDGIRYYGNDKGLFYLDDSGEKCVEVKLLDDCAENLNYWNGYLYYTVFENGETRLIQTNLKTLERTIKKVWENQKIGQLYLINDGEFLYSSGDTIFRLDSDTLEEATEWEISELELFAPTEYGYVYSVRNGEGYSVYLNQVLLAEQCEYFDIEELDRLYVSCFVNGDYSYYCLEEIPQYDVAAIYSAVETEAPEADEVKAYTSADLGLEIEIEKLFELLRTNEGGGDENLPSKYGAEATVDDLKAASNGETLTSNQKNIVKRARQMMEIEWTPLRDIQSFNNAKTFPAGKKIKGLLYGQCSVTGVNVPFSAKLEEFLDATKNPNSKLYTERGVGRFKRADGTYEYIECPYYSCDCSCFVSYAWGYSRQKSTTELKNNISVIRNSPKKVQVGDILLRVGVSGKSNHVILVVGVEHDANKEISRVITYESTTGDVYMTCEKKYTFEEYKNKLDKEKYSVYYYNTDKTSGNPTVISYTHNCAVPIDGDYCNKCVPFTISSSKFNLYEGNSKQVTTNQKAAWKSSNTSVATVDGSGLVTAVKAGTATITATWKGFKRTCEVTVKEKKLTLNKETATVYTGKTCRLEALTEPTAKVTWKSSDTSVATVEKGTVTGVKAGTATITAKANGITRKCKITVKNPSLEISKTELTVYTVKSETLTATAKPAETVTWKSSNPAIAKVSKNGQVTGVKEGKAIIRATANGLTRECKVTVKKPTLSLNKETMELYTGKTGTVTATVTPSTTVSWKSSNTAIATVSSSGEVKGIAAGKVDITASAHGISRTCTVTVKKPTIKISRSTAALYKGQTLQLTAQTAPSTTIKWTSANESRATVNGNGLVTAKAAGTVAIVASANGLSAGCVVTIKNCTLMLSSETATVARGKTLTLRATATPAATVTWRSGNTSVATVSNGVVRGVKAGTVNIMATANGITKICRVTVK